MCPEAEDINFSNFTTCLLGHLSDYWQVILPPPHKGSHDGDFLWTNNIPYAGMFVKGKEE